jgi:hypothetical protein
MLRKAKEMEQEDESPLQVCRVAWLIPDTHCMLVLATCNVFCSPSPNPCERCYQCKNEVKIHHSERARRGFFPCWATLRCLSVPFGACV